MRFHSRAGQELRTWILFFVGIGLAIVFAFKENPLNPWWTLVIGAFTCTAIIVSAVQTVAGGLTDATRKTLDELERKKLRDDQGRRDDPGMGPDEEDATSFSVNLGPNVYGFILPLRGSYSNSVQPAC